MVQWFRLWASSARDAGLILLGKLRWWGAPLQKKQIGFTVLINHSQGVSLSLNAETRLEN